MPDYYPSLYPDAVGPRRRDGNADPAHLRANCPATRPAFSGRYGLPLVFPGAYSRPQDLSNVDAYGWIHSPDPVVADRRQPVQFDRAMPTSALDYLQNINHNPLDAGDNLPHPAQRPGGFADLVGLPDLARDALAVLDRSRPSRSTRASSQPLGLQPTSRPARPAWVTRNASFLPGTMPLPAMTTLAGTPRSLTTTGCSTTRDLVPNGFFPRHRRTAAALDPVAGKTT